MLRRPDTDSIELTCLILIVRLEAKVFTNSVNVNNVSSLFMSNKLVDILLVEKLIDGEVELVAFILIKFIYDFLKHNISYRLSTENSFNGIILFASTTCLPVRRTVVVV